jgi:hypothetical protein
MANSKYFLNNDILGTNVNPSGERGIQAIDATDIKPPKYDVRFLEAFPTMWANGYAFRRAIEEKQPSYVQEWVCLFALRFFSILRVTTYSQSMLENNGDYDQDFWKAVHGSYPTRDLNFLRLLQTGDSLAVTVGVYYPDIIFFPTRGRSDWQRSQNLEPYLEGDNLSWQRIKQKLLNNEEAENRLHTHLRLIARVITGECRNALNQFCDNEFAGAFPDLTNKSLAESGTSADDPANWEHWHTKVDTSADNFKETQNRLLDAYPLKQPKTDGSGGTIYYLVNDMPMQSAWMSAQASTGPAPNQFLKTGDKEITVNFGDNKIKCPVQPNDDILSLKSLFLEKPFHCSIPLDDLQKYVGAIRTEIHQFEEIAPTASERAICLIPVSHQFVRHFPDLLQNTGGVERHNVLNKQVTWKFTILNKEVFWQVSYDGNKQDFHLRTAASIYPPRVSPKWKLYAMIGGGLRQHGRWNLIGEEGQKGEMIELTAGEYISVLHPGIGNRNRPCGLLFNDEAGEERGVLFTKELTDAGNISDDGAELAMDFGTSNTCLAYNTSDSNILRFNLVPAILWGVPLSTDKLGSIPKEWGGQKGFFPTILLSRRNDSDLADLKPDKVELKHLFKVDVACLHKNIGRLLTEDAGSNWNMHSDLKWSANPDAPWRKLFFEQVLFYAHAEMFFQHRAKISKYIFTFPLAFSESQKDLFHKQAKEVVQKIRRYCYNEDWTSNESNYLENIDESVAIASSISLGANNQTLDVFIDVGGGTADIAIRHNRTLCVLDSLKVAGQEFFNFTRRGLLEKSLPGSDGFREHLKTLLDIQNDNELKEELQSLRDLSSQGKKDVFDIFYSVNINELSDEDFKSREFKIIEEKMGTGSYQKYRSKLFFQHIIAYSLLQSCATVVSKKLKLTNGIRLILGGNAWGLMLFAEMKREKSAILDESNKILSLLKQKITSKLTDEERAELTDEEKERIAVLESLKIFDVNLLSAANLSEAKTKVALGALTASSGDSGLEHISPHIGISLNNLKLNDLGPVNLPWHERWDFDLWRKTFAPFEFLSSVSGVSFDEPDDQTIPFDSILTVFTGLGNLKTDARQDNMPAPEWANMNALLTDAIRGFQGDRLPDSPVNYFLSSLLYQKNKPESFLDKLAEANGIKAN